MAHEKLSLISVWDYPRTKYHVYWEIRIDEGSWEWGVRLYDYDTHQVVQETQGGAASENEARSLSQSWVKERIEDYRRP